MKLEDIKQGQVVAGIVAGKLVNVVAAERRGADVLELVYRLDGALGQRLLSRADEDGVVLASAPQASASNWRRVVTPKSLGALALLVVLAFGMHHFWRAAKVDVVTSGSSDMPVVIRTNGGWLEVATVKHRRTFNLTQMHTILGYPVPFCKESASLTIDTYITYRVKLAKRWYASYERQRLVVTAPKLEPALPVAFDTTKLQAALTKCALMPSLDTQNDLLRGIGRTLQQDAQSAHYITFARENGGRQTVREFVQKWLINQKGYNIPASAPIDVEFDGE